MCSDCAAELDGSGECKRVVAPGAALESRHSSTSKVADTTGKAERPLPRERGSKVRIACGDRHARNKTPYIHIYYVSRIVPASGARSISRIGTAVTRFQVHVIATTHMVPN
jgi:hypothetical protein